MRFVSLMWFCNTQTSKILTSVFRECILIIGNSLCEPQAVKVLIARVSAFARAPVNRARARSQVVLVADHSDL